MAIEVKCACGRHVKVPDDLGGEKVRCGSCGRDIPTPPPEALARTANAETDEIPRIRGAAEEETDPEGVPEPAAIRALRKGKNTPSGERPAAAAKASAEDGGGKAAIAEVEEADEADEADGADGADEAEDDGPAGEAGEGAGPARDASLEDTEPVPDPTLGGRLAEAEAKRDATALEPGRCKLCGLRNRPDDIICQGCETDLVSGEPPKLERPARTFFQRYDVRWFMLAGVALVVVAIGLGIRAAIRAGADRRAVARGEELLTRGDLGGAQAAFEEALGYDDSNADAETGLADIRLRRGETAKAAEHARRAIHQRPEGSARARTILARARLADHDAAKARDEAVAAAAALEEARREADRARDEAPDQPSLKHVLGHVRFHRGESAEALRLYDEALRTDRTSPETPLTLLRRGLILLELARPGQARTFEDAERALRDALDARAPEADVREALGDLEARRGAEGRERALEHYTQALRVSPTRPRTLFKLAWHLRLEKRYEAALEALEKARGLVPEDAAVRKLEGQVLLDLGDPERALRSFDEADRLRPRDAEVYDLRAQAWLAQKRPGEARRQLADAIGVDAGYVPAHVRLAELHASQNELEPAISGYRRVVALVPQKVEHRLRLAALLEDKGDATAAADEYERVVALDAADPKAKAASLDALVRLYKQLGKLDQAEDALARVVAARPDDPEPRVRQGQLRIARGDDLYKRGAAPAEVGRAYDAAIQLLQETIRTYSPAAGKDERIRAILKEAQEALDQARQRRQLRGQ